MLVVRVPSATVAAATWPGDLIAVSSYGLATGTHDAAALTVAARGVF
jgi:hypothetical protein